MSHSSHRASFAALTLAALGVVYGVGQMLRGAHYPSHTMWTAWICWAVTVGSVVLLNVSRAPGK